MLIVGAGGGIGTFAVQVAKSLGAHVTGACSTFKQELVLLAGAHNVIDYTGEDFTRGGERYDLILDNVLQHSLSGSASARPQRDAPTAVSSTSAGSGSTGVLMVKAPVLSLFVPQQIREAMNAHGRMICSS